MSLLFTKMKLITKVISTPVSAHLVYIYIYIYIYRERERERVIIETLPALNVLHLKLNYGCF